MSTQTPLTLLPRTLADNGYKAPTYRTCYEAARDCRIPASLDRGNRWYFNEADLPAIAQALGLSDALAA
jgi:hypothetical protein